MESRWWGHIGGFAFGALAMLVLGGRRRAALGGPGRGLTGRFRPSPRSISIPASAAWRGLPRLPRPPSEETAMRRDLDRLMQQRGLGGMVVFSYDRYNPAMYYATGQKIHYGIYFRAPDGRAHLVHDPMERDQAAKVGCEHSSFAQHGMLARLQRETHPARAFAGLIGDVLDTLGMQGPIAFFGDLPAGFAYELLEQLKAHAPGVEVDRSHPDVITLARMTKDADELESIRNAAHGAVAAHEQAAPASRHAARATATHFRANGAERVTLGDLRRLLHEEFLTYGLEGGESIVSQGRDAGVPHNRGNDAEPPARGRAAPGRHLPRRGRRRILQRPHPHLLPGTAERRAAAPLSRRARRLRRGGSVR